jgi:quinol-cytochrome oxidoreductase complex cytochrome b subunit
MTLGTAAVFIFVLTVVSGFLIMFYYVPSAQKAYESMENIRKNVFFGQLILNIHYWGLNFILILAILHMSLKIYLGAYRPPRRFNWVIGVLLLLLCMSYAFTGSLLFWDENAYWRITIMANIIGSLPLLGEKLSYFVIGGYDIGQNTLLRIYVMHFVVLPLLISCFIYLHVKKYLSPRKISFKDLKI